MSPRRSENWPRLLASNFTLSRLLFSRNEVQQVAAASELKPLQTWVCQSDFSLSYTFPSSEVLVTSSPWCSWHQGECPAKALHAPAPLRGCGRIILDASTASFPFFHSLQCSCDGRQTPAQPIQQRGYELSVRAESKLLLFTALRF